MNRTNPDTLTAEAMDLYYAACAMMKYRHNLEEHHWQNLENAAMRLNAAEQSIRINTLLNPTND